jgi:hypothetical protein
MPGDAPMSVRPFDLIGSGIPEPSRDGASAPPTASLALCAVLLSTQGYAERVDAAIETIARKSLCGCSSQGAKC